MAERPLASALLRLLAARADRLAAFSDVDWDKALAWLRGRSEYPAVVIPLTMGSWMMLQRNLLYTGVTRAKKLVVLAGAGPGRVRVPCGPGGRTGLTGHRALSRATATMSHRGGQVRDDVTSSRLARGGPGA
jgi:exodeoxyribonuclease V alpha subunit